MEIRQVRAKLFHANRQLRMLLKTCRLLQIRFVYIPANDVIVTTFQAEIRAHRDASLWKLQNII
jgi:hypothetical protein